jgi:hypothetical protein
MDSEKFECLNTTGYDKNIGYYICTPPCPKPTGNEFNEFIIHDWTDNTTWPELADIVTYSCNNGHQIVTLDNFVGAIVGGPANSVNFTCEMNGKFDKSKYFRSVVASSKVFDFYLHHVMI